MELFGIIYIILFVPFKASHKARTKEADWLDIRQAEEFSQNSWWGGDKNTNFSKYAEQCFRAYLGKMLWKKKALLHHTHGNQILPLMGCSQHEVHTTLICTCRYAALQVFLRHVHMCTLSPRLEYKLPKGRTWVFSFSPAGSGILAWAGQALGKGWCRSGEQGKGGAKPPAVTGSVKNTGEHLCHHQGRVITCASDVPTWPLSQASLREGSETAGGSWKSLRSLLSRSHLLPQCIPQSLLKREYKITATKQGTKPNRISLESVGAKLHIEKD